MKKIINPGNVFLNLIAPPSKSIAIRMVAATLLSLRNVGDSASISDFPTCDDALVALNIAQNLGYAIERDSLNNVTITRTNANIADAISCGESALCYRLFPYISAFLGYKIDWIAEGTLRSRVGKWQMPEINTGVYDMDCITTSQELSASLFALPLCKEDTRITAKNLRSSGYIDLTIDILRQFGIVIDRNGDEFTIDGNQTYKPANTTIEGDWSCVANLFVLGAIGGTVTIANLNKNSLQPDVAILNLFNDLNIACRELAEGVFRIGKSNYNGFEYDGSNTPDLIPPLVVLALNALSPSKISGIDRLVNKESNRRDVLLKVFSMFGAKIRICDDGNSFELTPSKISGGFADSHNDHRIAMAVAIAAQVAKKATTLTGIECVNKSFPDFFNYIR